MCWPAAFDFFLLQIFFLAKAQRRKGFFVIAKLLLCECLQTSQLYAISLRLIFFSQRRSGAKVLRYCEAFALRMSPDFAALCYKCSTYFFSRKGAKVCSSLRSHSTCLNFYALPWLKQSKI
jgi:hypothetical protein